jgi:hypothetical protein
MTHTNDLGQRLYVTWSRCLVDRKDHAITDEEFARGVRRQKGRFVALCGHELLIESILMPPAPPCPRCRAHLAARVLQQNIRGQSSPPMYHGKTLRKQRRQRLTPRLAGLAMRIRTVIE